MSESDARNRHLRGQEFHFGELSATDVQFTLAIGSDVAIGDTLEEVIGRLSTRVYDMDDAVLHTRTFSISAYVRPYVHVDAAIKAPVASSFITDAIIMPTFAVDAFVRPWFTIDARVGVAPTFGSFTADAWVPDYFTADAWVVGSAYVLTDHKEDSAIAAVPVLGVTDTYTANVLGFDQADATDPTTVLDEVNNSAGAYTAWVRLYIGETTRVNINTYAYTPYDDIPGTSHDDTALYLFGPMDDPPGPSDEPLFFSDDSYPNDFDRYQSKLLDNALDYPKGNEWYDYWYGDGNADPYAEDPANDGVSGGVTLGAGMYWILVCPYSGSIDTGAAEVGLFVNISRIQFFVSTMTLDATLQRGFKANALICGLPLVDIDAIIMLPVPGSLTVDAEIIGHHFTIDAMVKSTVTWLQPPVMSGFGLSLYAGTSYIYPYQSNFSFTHNKISYPATPDDSIVFVFTRSRTNQVPSWVTYGGQQMTLVTGAYYSDYVTVWMLDDLSAIASRTVYVSGSSMYAYSVSFGSDQDPNVVLKDSVGVDASYRSPADYYTTLTSDTPAIAAASILFQFSNSGPYITVLDNDTAWAITVSGYYSTRSIASTQESPGMSLDAGVRLTQPVYAGYVSVLAGYETTSLGFSIDAYVRPQFRVEAEIALGGDITIDAFVSPWFSIDATIVALHFTIDAAIKTVGFDPWAYEHARMDGPFGMSGGPPSTIPLRKIYLYERNK